MKRLIVALLVGATVFAVAFAAAAALNVDGGVLQAGDDDVLMCDDSGVQIYFRTGAGPGVTWDATEKDFIVDHVVVGGLDADCDGLVLEVVVTDCDGNKLAGGQQDPLVRDPTNPSVALDSPVPASDIYDVHVLLQD